MAGKSAKQRGSGSSRSGDAGSWGVVAIFLGVGITTTNALGMYMYGGLYILNAFVMLGFGVMIAGLGIELYDILRTLREIRDK